MRARRKMMKTRLILVAVVSVLALALSACNSSPSNSITGTWRGSNLSLGVGSVDALMTVDSSTYEALLYAVGTTTLQDGSNRGTYSYSGETFQYTRTQEYNGAAWQSSSATGSNHVVVSGNTMTVDQDFNADGVVDATWSLTRQ
jgi:hypothetical protein